MKTKRTTGSRIMTLVMALTITLTGMGMTEVVSAANTTDESWTYQAEINNSTEIFLNKRNKNNSTKIYVKWTSSYGGNISAIWVSPYGTRNNNNTFLPAGTMAGGNATYAMPGPGQYSITNCVNELGMTYASVAMKAKTGYGTAYGVWSPDSTRNYTILY